MFWTNVKRVTRSGFINFWRNSSVTIAALLVMTITLFVLGSLIFLSAMLDASLVQLKDKVDVNVYFTTDAREADILGLKTSLEALPEVAFVEYVSRDQALEDFRLRHEDDDLILQALDELNDNPLGAHFNVKARETSQYEGIATFLESNDALASNGRVIIDNVNYFQNRVAIERLTDVIKSIDTLSIVILVVFLLISALIIYNTIRLAIYTSREEIQVMRLVGASRSYIRGPFVIEGVMYGIVGALIVLVLFYPITLWTGPFSERFFGTTNAFDYYVDNFAQMFIILMATGVILGGLSSFVAIKKYLKI